MYDTEAGAAQPSTVDTAEVLPAAYAPRVARIRAAVESGDGTLAARLTEELRQDIEARRGAGHPEVLRAQEVQAHVAAAGADWVRAGELYAEAAAAWASRGAWERWTAERNAEFCRRQARVATPTLVSSPAAGGSSGWPPARVLGRGTVVALGVLAALLAGAVSSIPPSRPDDVALPDQQVVAPVLVGALQGDARPAPMPTPVQPSATLPVSPPPTFGEPGLVEEPAPEGGADVQGSGPADDGPVRPRPGRTPALSGRSDHGGPASAPRPQPGPVPEPAAPASGGGTDPCGAARQVGQLPGSLVELCQRAAGMSGRRSAPPVPWPTGRRSVPGPPAVP
ncbi:hypothetical protein P3T27_007522 [Kitasatospora sp. MAA19]|nr:hypothetical protein [Kitasatospora sp. MAA19]